MMRGVINSDKTEILLLGPKAVRCKLSDSAVNLDGLSVSCAAVKDLGEMTEYYKLFKVLQYLSKYLVYYILRITEYRLCVAVKIYIYSAT